MENEVRTRFAPSPTGYLHIGGLRTALYDFLYARNQKGKFILRIEDTDRSRYVESAVENLIKTLNWAGLEYDEGVVIDSGKTKNSGDRGPYLQSERLDLYKKYADQIVDQGDAYYCFCSKERLEKLRKKQTEMKMPTKYDRKCRGLSKEEVRNRLKNGDPYVIRMKIPSDEKIFFEDKVRGKVEFNSDEIDDQVIIKEDGYPTYHLAVVVDDHLMGINQVIRGEEWLSSTPKHILLYRYLDFKLPKFAHLPLLLNADKTKLSKRKGDVAVEDYIKKGYLPEALINFVAFLGWNPKTNQELFSMDQLIKEFSLKKVNKAGAIVNIQKLDWFGNQYLKEADLVKLEEMAIPFLEKRKYVVKDKILIDEEKIGYNTEFIKSVLDFGRFRSSYMDQVMNEIEYVFLAPDLHIEMIIGKFGDRKSTKANLDSMMEFITSADDLNKDNIEERVLSFVKESGKGNGEMLWPLRVALTGRDKSPNQFEIIKAYLELDDRGKQIVISRMKRAIDML